MRRRLALADAGLVGGEHVAVVMEHSETGRIGMSDVRPEAAP